MKTLTRLILALAFLAVLSSAAWAKSISTPVTPNNLNQWRYAFDIKEDRLQDGNVLFRITITAPKEADLDEFIPPARPAGTQIFTEEMMKSVRNVVGLGTRKTSGASTTSDTSRSLQVERNGKTLSCLFVVPEKSLADPDFCFFFTRAGSGVADSWYARLKDFYKPVAVAANAARQEK